MHIKDHVAELISICTDKNIKISTAESFTAGLIASTIASCPGASNILYGGAVTYMTEAKNNFLNIPMDYIDKYGVVSKEVCKKMAYSISQICNTNVGIGATGNAGPGTDAGHVFVSIFYKKKFYTLEMFLDKNRNEVRETAVNTVILKLLEIIKEVK